MIFFSSSICLSLLLLSSVEPKLVAYTSALAEISSSPERQPHKEDTIRGRNSHRNMNSQVDNPTGGHFIGLTLHKDDLTGRQPHRKTTSQSTTSYEDDLRGTLPHGKMTSHDVDRHKSDKFILFGVFYHHLTIPFVFSSLD